MESATAQAQAPVEDTKGQDPSKPSKRQRRLNEREANSIASLLLLSDRPLSAAQLARIIHPDNPPSEQSVVEELTRLRGQKAPSLLPGLELVEVAQGWRWQVAIKDGSMAHRLYNEKPPRYSRAILETLAIIAWRGPVTRGDIESIRGVTVSPLTIRTLKEREWIVVKGYRDTPGRPDLFVTTKQFLDDFSLKNLDDLPPLPALDEAAHSASAEEDSIDDEVDRDSLHHGLGLYPDAEGDDAGKDADDGGDFAAQDTDEDSGAAAMRAEGQDEEIDGAREDNGGAAQADEAGLDGRE